MEGIGRYWVFEGVSYEGQFLNDKKHGYGKYSWKDARYHEGWWHEGLQHGLGIYKSINEEKLYGRWENGKKVEGYNEEQVKQIESHTLNIENIPKH